MVSDHASCLKQSVILLIVNIRELYVSFHTLSIPALHNRQTLMIVHNTLYHSNLLLVVSANYFTFNTYTQICLTRSHSDNHIYT